MSPGAHAESRCNPLPVCLTQLVFSRVVGNLHDVELQTRVALPDAVDTGDVRTRLVHGPHQLGINIAGGREGILRLSFMKNVRLL